MRSIFSAVFDEIVLIYRFWSSGISLLSRYQLFRFRVIIVVRMNLFSGFDIISQGCSFFFIISICWFKSDISFLADAINASLLSIMYLNKWGLTSSHLIGSAIIWILGGSISDSISSSWWIIRPTTNNTFFIHNTNIVLTCVSPFAILKHCIVRTLVQGDSEIYTIIVTMASRTVLMWNYRNNKLKVEWGKTSLHHPRYDATDPPFKQ